MAAAASDFGGVLEDDGGVGEACWRKQVEARKSRVRVRIASGGGVQAAAAVVVARGHRRHAPRTASRGVGTAALAGAVV